MITHVHLGRHWRCLEFFQLTCHELQGSFWQLKSFAVENSALREIVEIFRS